VWYMCMSVWSVGMCVMYGYECVCMAVYVCEWFGRVWVWM